MARYIALNAGISVCGPGPGGFRFALEYGMLHECGKLLGVCVLQFVGENHARKAGTNGHDPELFAWCKGRDIVHWDLDIPAHFFSIGSHGREASVDFTNGTHVLF